VVYDLAEREVARRASFGKQSMLYDKAARLASRLFVEIVEAKFLSRPAVALAPDESWIAFADWSDIESGDGLWAVETAGLGSLGHWLQGETVVGISSASDANRLVVLVRDPKQLLTIEPRTGRVIHRVQVPFAESSGLVDD
jgi:hypothetical protein